MKIKYILFISLFALLFIQTGNAVEYLNSCGKSSGWVNGETYILNFSEQTIPTCFLIPLNIFHSNMTFIGTQPINLLYNNSNFFTDSKTKSTSDYTYINSNNSFINISFYSNVDFTLNSFYKAYSGYRYFSKISERYYNFKNISLDLKANSFIDVGLEWGTDNSYPNHNTMYYNNFENIYLPKTNYFYYNSIVHAPSTYSYFNHNNISNVYFNGISFFNYNQGSYILYNQIKKSVILTSGSPKLGNSYNYDLSYGTMYLGYNTYTNSILEGYKFNDINNDGVGETDVGINYDVNPAIFLNLFGYNFFQDFSEGEGYYISNSIPSQENIFVNDEQIVGTGNLIAPFSTPNGYDNNFYGNIIIDTMNGFMINGGIDCNILLNGCNIQDSPTYNSQISNNFKGLLNIGTNINIDNMKFTKTGSNNAHIIANFQDNYYNNMKIRNNTFNKNDYNFFNGNNYLIKLKGNNIDISNNLFNLTSNYYNGYEVLDILATNPSSNLITNNKFIYNTNETFPSLIFTENGDAIFWNNYIGSNVQLTNLTSGIGLAPNKLITYQYNNNVYYWNIGNYYEDNVLCQDIANDGICDSPYISGSYQDDYPLSSYPFVPSSHLLTAEYNIPINEYNVTIHNLFNGETINLNDGSEGLVFQFSHNSDYPDLECNYLLDGSTIGIQSTPNKDIIYNYTKTGGWTTKTYSFRVECYNSINGYIISDEYLFNVILSSIFNVCGNAILETGESCDDGNTLNGDGCSDTCSIEGGGGAICGNGIWEFTEQCDDGNLFNDDGCSSLCLIETTSTTNQTTSNNVYGGAGTIITGDIGETTDNIVGFFGDLSNGALSIIIPVGLFLFVFLMIGGALALIR